MNIELSSSLRADLNILARKHRESLEQYVLRTLQEQTLGMHITAESLDILKKGIQFTSYLVAGEETHG